jgi:hypothetical protein
VTQGTSAPFTPSTEDLERALMLSTTQKDFLLHVARDPRWFIPSSFEALWEPNPLFTSRVQPWPFFVARRVVQQVHNEVDRLVRLFERSVIARARAGLTEAARDLGNKHHELLERIGAHGPGLARSVRADLLETEAGFACIELNVSGSLGGWQLMVLEQRLMACAPAAEFIQALPRAKLLEPLTCALRVFDERARARGGHIVLLDPWNRPVAFGEMAEQMLRGIAETVLERAPAPLHFRGVNTLVREGGRVVLSGIPRVAVCVDGGAPVSLDPESLDFSKDPEMDQYCGPLGEVLCDKRTLAWLSEDADQRRGMSDDDAVFVSRFLPHTRVVRPGPVTWRGSNTTMEELLSSQQAHLVLKAPDTYGGKDIFIGDAIEADLWEDVSRRALAERWVVQERLPNRTRPMFSDDGKGSAAHLLVWGAFLIDGRSAGFYPRVLPEGRGDVVNLARGGQSALAFEVDGD